MQGRSSRIPALPFRGAVGFVCVWLLAALFPIPTHATILLFDQQRDAATQTVVGPTGSGGTVPGDYGDNVSSALMAVPGGFFTYGDGGEGFTPDVTLEIFSAAATPGNPRVSLWQSDYGDLTNVVFGEGAGVGGAPSLSVLFTAAPGFVVDLYGFELGGWNRTDYTIAGVEVLAGASSLFAATNVLVEGDASGPGHTTFDFATPLSAPDILLRLDLSNLSSGIQDNIGIDSIRFGQTPPGVPEPGTASLLLGAILLGAMRRWRG